MACKRVDEAVKDVESKLVSNKLGFGKVNFDECPILSKKYECELIPLLVLFKNGIELIRSEGAKNPQEIRKFIIRNLQS